MHGRFRNSRILRLTTKGDKLNMVSIKDVAKEAGVSATTVSAVVNGLDCVKPSTRERVLEAIDR